MFNNFSENTNSSTQKIMENMALFGADIPNDEADPRGLPDIDPSAELITKTMEELAACFSDTALERDLPSLLWGIVNSFHSQSNRQERRFDELRREIETLMRQQDGSEIASHELEKKQSLAHEACDKQAFFEELREAASDSYLAITGQAWTPYRGSKTSEMTASMIDSRDFINARKLLKSEKLIPEGTAIVITGGIDFKDTKAVFATLDKVQRKYPDMVLFHGGAQSGVDAMARSWAANRNVHQVAFKPDFKKHQKAAGFKRNDQIIAQMPKGLIAFKGSGVNDNLVTKARKAGIKVLDCRT